MEGLKTGDIIKTKIKIKTYRTLVDEKRLKEVESYSCIYDTVLTVSYVYNNPETNDMFYYSTWNDWQLEKPNKEEY